MKMQLRAQRDAQVKELLKPGALEKLVDQNRPLFLSEDHNIKIATLLATILQVYHAYQGELYEEDGKTIRNSDAAALLLLVTFAIYGLGQHSIVDAVDSLPSQGRTTVQ